MATTIGRIASRWLLSQPTPLYNCKKTWLRERNPTFTIQHAGFKAAVLEKFEEPLVVKDVKPQKKLNDTEVRIDVHKCGVNSSDVLTIEGEYVAKPKLPFVPGFEIAGEVQEVGATVIGLQTGDKVIGLSKDRFGGFAEECVLDAKDVWRVPMSLSFSTCAALADSYGTALLGLARRGNLKEGDEVLVTAAAGGLGLAALDVAANVYRAKVIGVCTSEDRASLVRDKGAWAALKYDPKTLLKTVNDNTDGKGVKIVFEAVGGEVFEQSIKCVAHEGRVIVAGFASRKVPTIQTSMLLPKSFSLIGLSLSHYREADLNVYRQIIQDVIDMCEQGLISPHISCEFPLAEVNEASKFMKEHKSTGKVILSLR